MSDIPKLVAELRELEKFLDGSGDIDGITYGERHPDYRGNYWWRALLHERFFQAIQALEQMAENDAKLRKAVEALEWLYGRTAKGNRSLLKNELQDRIYKALDEIGDIPEQT